jgi:hypothetical protein
LGGRAGRADPFPAPYARDPAAQDELFDNIEQLDWKNKMLHATPYTDPFGNVHEALPGVQMAVALVFGIIAALVIVTWWLAWKKR